MLSGVKRKSVRRQYGCIVICYIDVSLMVNLHQQQDDALLFPLKLTLLVSAITNTQC